MSMCPCVQARSLHSLLAMLSHLKKARLPEYPKCSQMDTPQEDEAPKLRVTTSYCRFSPAT